MRQSGKNVETAVPAGSNVPLGPVFIRFGDQPRARWNLGMHGTNVPSSVPALRHGLRACAAGCAQSWQHLVEKGVPVTVTTSRCC